MNLSCVQYLGGHVKAWRDAPGSFCLCQSRYCPLQSVSQSPNPRSQRACWTLSAGYVRDSEPLPENCGCRWIGCLPVTLCAGGLLMRSGGPSGPLPRRPPSPILHPIALQWPDLAEKALPDKRDEAILSRSRPATIPRSNTECT